MTFRTWSDAVNAINGATGPATTEQLELAQQAGVRIPADIPKIVAGAMLRIALAEELNLTPARPFSDRYENRLKSPAPVIGSALRPSERRGGVCVGRTSQTHATAGKPSGVED